MFDFIKRRYCEHAYASIRPIMTSWFCCYDDTLHTICPFQQNLWTLLHSHQIIYADNISLTPSGQGHYNGKRWHWLSHTHTHTHCSNQITLCWYSCWAGHNLMRTSVVRSNAITGLMQDLACTQTVTHRAGGRSALQQKLSLSTRSLLM